VRLVHVASQIALKMGWTPAAATRETAYEHLMRRVPAELRFDLHCLLVEHGKVEKNNLGCLSKVKKENASKKS
jgi:endonuclease III